MITVYTKDICQNLLQEHYRVVKDADTAGSLINPVNIFLSCAQRVSRPIGTTKRKHTLIEKLCIGVIFPLKRLSEVYL
jgi:hypothetical protein